MNGSIEGLHFRAATAADATAMAACRLTDPAAGLADPRMAAYFNGEHHPQQALPPRTGFIASTDAGMVGYIAGHLTTRHGCAGEVQYLFVTPEHRRHGVATELLRQLARWFEEQGARKVCVCVDADSPAAQPFYKSAGASPIKKFWYAWDDVNVIR